MFHRKIKEKCEWFPPSFENFPVLNVKDCFNSENRDTFTDIRVLCR